jgi:hypothetical protein
MSAMVTSRLGTGGPHGGSIFFHYHANLILCGVITQGTISLLLGLTVGYEIEPVGAGGGWYLGFLVWGNSFGVRHHIVFCMLS